MPTLRTVTGDLANTFPGVVNLPGLKLEAEHNLPSDQYLIDTTNGAVYVTQRQTIPLSGTTFSVELFDTDSTDLNVTAGDLQWQLIITHPTADGKVATKRTGWFSLTADIDLADPGFLPSPTPTVVQTAAAFIAQMEAIRDEQLDISGIDTSEGVMAAVLGSGGLFDAELQDVLNGISFSVKQFGAVGDGVSRPLSTVFGSLAAAQAAFPMPYLEAATWASRELDWAAGQYANHLISPLAGGGQGGRVFWPKGHYVTNMGIYVGDDSVNEGEGPGTWIDNIHPRNTPTENQYNASPFYLGIDHPAIMGAGNSYRYRIASLAPITAGDRTLTVTTPAEVDAPLAAGDIVLIRCNNTPDTFGSAGVVYAYAQWNRVESWNAGTGTLVLEEPMDQTIVATPTDSVVGGPKLLVNPGSGVIDPIAKLPWKVVQRAHLRGMRLSGHSPLGTRTAGWNCSVRDIVGEFQHLWSSNAFVNSLAENITGTFSNRFAEIKHVCQGSTFRRIQGTYKYDAAVTTDPPISIGEASYRIRLEDCGATFGEDYTVTHRAFETSTVRDLYADVELRFHPSSGVQAAWIIKSTPHPSLPPSDIHLKLKVRGASGLVRYGTIGSDAIIDGIDNEGNPNRITLDLDQKAETKPTYCYRVDRGHNIREIRNVSDERVLADTPSLGDLVDGGIYKVIVPGPLNIPANSSIRLGPYTGKGITVGDHMEATASGGAFSSGNPTYLTASARVSSSETWYLMLRNEYPTGGTTITITGNVTVRYRLRRVV